jgi:membrane protein required for colicin V production
MSWVDWAIVFIMVAAVLGGLAQGFFRSFCSLFGLILGLGVASWNYGRLSAMIMPLARVRAVADAISFILIALVIMAIFALLGAVLAKAFRMLGLGCLDALAGAVFGFVQGVFLVTLCILVIAAFYPDETWLAEAKLPRMFLSACHLSIHITPSELGDRIRRGLKTLEIDSTKLLQPDHR